jgi:uncharacterized protein with HEPN domain
MHMLESARLAVRIAAGLTAATLADDELRMPAVIRYIEVVGEAATKVSKGTQRNIPGIDWQGVRRMRNRLIHGYDTVEPARVWDALALDLPHLIGELERAMAAWPPDPHSPG